MGSIPENVSKEINVWAAAGGATAAAAPIGVDSVLLSAEEIVMIIRLGTVFGVNIEKSAATGILSALVASGVGQAAAFAAFEAANLGYPFTIPVKVGIAVGLIETVGRAAYCYFENEYEHG